MKNTKGYTAIIKLYCNIYDLDYNKNQNYIWDMLIQKIKDTNEDITEFDIKEVCKIIAEDKY